MPFDQTTIGPISAVRDGRDLVVSWTSTAPAGSTFQVYVGGRLAWHGTARSVHLPWPRGSNTPIAVGVVPRAEAAVDYSADLPAYPRNWRTLTWEGGTYLGPDIGGFRVYSDDGDGGAVVYSRVLADLPAYPGGVVTDGFGMGGFGHGGFGRSASDYAWTTPSLAPGDWTFAVAAYDGAGNEDIATPTTVAFAIAGPPRPPAATSRGVRLTYTYDADTQVATLHWLPSPG